MGLKEKARYLRNNSTSSEVKLWQYLKGKNIKVFDFHRQKPINNYIVDFYCTKLKLAIEVDGSTHGDKINYDEKRQKIIESLGVSFLRFTHSQVMNDIDSVLRTIVYRIETHP